MAQDGTTSTKKVFDGRYEILSIVGRGSRSVVYHARHVNAPQVEVALKVLLTRKDGTSTSERLRKEALAMVSARHKNVIRLDDFHSLGSLCYLAMEYAPEADLRKYIDSKHGFLPMSQIELFLRQILEALSFIHQAGIIHRDLKPENILVVDDRSVRLGDFGVAVLPGERASFEELQKGVGTMDYMAPEVLEGLTYDKRSDVYALGVTFYEIISGSHPFRDVSMIQQLDVRHNDQIIHLRELAPDVPEYLANAIMQAMSYDPADRFASGREFLAAILAGRPESDSTTAGRTRIRPRFASGSILGRGQRKKFRIKLRNGSPAQKTPDPIMDAEELNQQAASLLSSYGEAVDDQPEQLPADPISEAAETQSEITYAPVNPAAVLAEPAANLAATESAPITEAATEPETYVDPYLSRFSGAPTPTAKVSAAEQESFAEEPVQDLTSDTSVAETAEASEPATSLEGTTGLEKETRPTNLDQELEKPRSSGLLIQLILIGALAILGTMIYSRIFSGSANQTKSSATGSSLVGSTFQESNPLLPVAEGAELPFPAFAVGSYFGSISGLVPGKEISLSLISRSATQAPLAILGIPGWVPVTATVIPPQGQNASRLSIKSGGFALELTGQNKNGTVSGNFKNIVTGGQGAWSVKLLN